MIIPRKWVRRREPIKRIDAAISASRAPGPSYQLVYVGKGNPTHLSRYAWQQKAKKLANTLMEGRTT